jgi:hypothetical protein
MKFKAIYKKYRFWWETLILLSIRVIFDLVIEDNKIMDFGYKNILELLISSMLGAGLTLFFRRAFKNYYAKNYPKGYNDEPEYN